MDEERDADDPGSTPCVRVPARRAESTRQRLVDASLLDRDRRIETEDGTAYIPVTHAERVPTDFDVVDRAVPVRDRQRMPADLLDFDPTYERLGDIVILDEDDPDRATAAARAILNSAIAPKTVVNRASPVSGETRVRDWEILAGSETETVHREYGYEFLLDIDRVYFSPRLATERHRVIEQVAAGERVIDMFAGVGPFSVPMAGRGATVVAVDINPDAVAFLRENARRNGVADRVTAIEGDVRGLESEYDGWADRIVMNLPHSADDFLETAVALAGEECMLHYYDIQSDEDPFGPGERAIRAAAGTTYAVSIATRRVVRSYAPHEVNVVIDARLIAR